MKPSERIKELIIKKFHKHIPLDSGVYFDAILQVLDEIVEDLLYEISLTNEDRKKMRQIAKNPDGTNKTLDQLFKEI
jgi:uncharacterized caspase-like protein